jgi:hypothetical protein
VFISQDRRMFSSLLEAQNQIIESGRRVVIGNEEQVVTFRPQTVKTFPGTIEQLFELGKKLGAYPIKVFKKKKRECEKRDHSKEVAFSKTIGHMIFLSEQRANTLVHYLLLYVRSLIDRLELHHLARVDGVVSDLLLSFRIDISREGDLYSVTGMEACEEHLEKLVVEMFEKDLIRFLKENEEDNLRVWINDPYSAFNTKYSVKTSDAVLYKILLQHPDILQQHKACKERIRSEFYNLDANLIFTRESPQSIEINTNSDFSSSIRLWNTKDIFEIFTKEQIYTILNTYFSLMNPIQVIQELTTYRSMIQVFLKDHRDVYDPNTIEQLETLLSKMDRLREFEPIFQANPQILHAHYIKQFKIAQMNSDYFNGIKIEGDQGMDRKDDERPKEWFKETILERKELTWEDKGILSFAFFLGAGCLELDEIMKYSHSPRSVLRRTIQRMESNKVLLTCDDCGSLHIKWVSELGWEQGVELLHQLPMKSFESFIKDDELSWAAKGIYTWIKCSDSSSIYEIEKLAALSNTPPQLVELAFHELIDQGYVVQPGVSGTADLQANEHRRIKDILSEWYINELRPALNALISLPGEKAHVLNAKYPTKYGYTAIQTASIVDDVAMVEALLKVDGIMILDSNDLTQHPLLLSYYSGSHAATERLLEDRRVIEQEELINIFFGSAIMEEIPAEQLCKYLNKLDVPDKSQVVSKFLLPALMRKNEDAIRVLLKAGACPHTVIVDKKTAMDIAKDREEVDIILLFKQYSN